MPNAERSMLKRSMLNAQRSILNAERSMLNEKNHYLRILPLKIEH
jgi:hypothetical protein